MFSQRQLSHPFESDDFVAGFVPFAPGNPPNLWVQDTTAGNQPELGLLRWRASLQSDLAFDSAMFGYLSSLLDGVKVRKTALLGFTWFLQHCSDRLSKMSCFVVDSWENLPFEVGGVIPYTTSDWIPPCSPKHLLQIVIENKAKKKHQLWRFAKPFRRGNIENHVKAA